MARDFPRPISSAKTHFRKSGIKKQKGYKAQSWQLLNHKLPRVLLCFYLLPRLLPAGGFLSCSRGTPVPKPAAGALDTPKVSPAEGLIPGLLKLKPEVLVPPKPGKATSKCKELGREKKKGLWFHCTLQIQDTLVPDAAREHNQASSRWHSKYSVGFKLFWWPLSDFVDIMYCNKALRVLVDCTVVIITFVSKSHLGKLVWLNALRQQGKGHVSLWTCWFQWTAHQKVECIFFFMSCNSAAIHKYSY